MLIRLQKYFNLCGRLLAKAGRQSNHSAKARDGDKIGGGGKRMHLAIELPEDIAERLTARWGDLSQAAREAIAIEGYRSGALSQAEVQRLLGLASRWATDA